jgi:hypothetical protein
MKYYVTTDKHGLQSCHECEQDAKIPRGGTEVPRLPEAFERWDKKRGDFFKDEAAIMNAKREEAAKAIVEISPLWQQLNDIRARLDAAVIGWPDLFAAERFKQIDAIRAASNNRGEG